MNEEIITELQRSEDIISRIDPAQIRKAAYILIETFRKGDQAIFMGNGGSSADAHHIVAEFLVGTCWSAPRCPASVSRTSPL